MSRRFLSCLLAAWLFVGGCSADRNLGELLVPDDVGVLVLDGFLVVGRPLPAMRLTRTANPDATFELEQITVPDVARFLVRIWRDGQVLGDPIEYRYNPNIFAYQPAPGVGGVHRVLPDTRYDLEIVTWAEERLTATTTTPPAFSIPEWVILDEAGESTMQTLTHYDEVTFPDQVYKENEVVYSVGLLEAQFERPDVPAFQVGIFSLDLDSDYVIDPDFFEEEDFEDLDRIGSSPPLAGEDGTLRLPWFAIYFEGRYKVKIYAMDQNFYDLVRSAPELSGGGPGFGGQIGDNFERPIFNIEGGIGLFGSAAVDSIGFFVKPRP